MAKKPVDRAYIDLVRAGVTAHHVHRWIKELQRSLAKAEPDWQAYRNALAYLTLTEKHLTDWLSLASEASEATYAANAASQPGPRAVPRPPQGGLATAAGKGPRRAKRKAAPRAGRTVPGKRSAAGSGGAIGTAAGGSAILQAADA